ILCNGSGNSYRSIFPPLANHYASDPDNFATRLKRIDDEELSYLCELIGDGSESLGCIPPEYLDELINLIRERLGEEKARFVLNCYAADGGCGI
ncbi:MAG: hypothetical protein PHP13_07490, partial [Methanomicrobium sp.]|nr:hypothetical protein [Methanomicrobium sp.]